MSEVVCDVAVIGAGTAGLSAERKARACGARTLLIDPAFAGTTCATVGCMPSKLLIAAAAAAHAAETAPDFGIHVSSRVAGPAVMARVRRMRDEFAQGVRDGIADLPDGIALKGRARFEAPGRLVTDTGHSIRAGAVVIATGSRPSIPGPYQGLGDLVLTNESVFDLEDLPASLGVIGAGPIGIEIAQAMARLGVRVEVFDIGERLAGLPDETGRHLHRILSAELPIHLGVTPEARAVDGGIEIAIDGHSATFERLLVATGRPPALEGLGLDNAGLDLDADGVPVFDSGTMQCGQAPVFIAGDVNGDRPLLHEASDEGALAGHNAAYFPEVAATRRKLPFALTFTRPAAATIGRLPEAEDGLVTGRADFARQGRTRVDGHPGGLLRLHALAATGHIVGADMCLPEGEHIAHLLAWAIESGIDAREALRLPLYHPTVEEGIRGALRDLCGQVERGPDWDTDEGDAPGT